jgi:hypothetical protein
MKRFAAVCLLVLTSACVAQTRGRNLTTVVTTYAWVTAAAPPANSVSAPDAPHQIVCRGLDGQSHLWVGNWTGTQCLGSDSGSAMPANTMVQFLTLLAGSLYGPVQWLPAGTPGAVSAGDSYNAGPMVICAVAGHVGYLWSGQCSLSNASDITHFPNTLTVLVGTVQPLINTAPSPLPAYNWVNAASPPATSVHAPNGSAVCRATASTGPPWAGFWNGTTCVGEATANTAVAPNGLQFLTTYSGAPLWLQGQYPGAPGYISDITADALDAGETYNGPQLLCAQGGRVGVISPNGYTCQIGSSGIDYNTTAQALMGTVVNAALYPPFSSTRGLAANGTGPAVYHWVAASTRPSNVVPAPASPNTGVCRGSLGGKLYGGYFTGGLCVSSDSGDEIDATDNIQVLTLVSGAVQWTPAQAASTEDPGPIPANAVIYGTGPDGGSEPICSISGYVGRVYTYVGGSANGQKICSVALANPMPATGPSVLFGTVQ